MLVKDYFQQINEVINGCAIVQSVNANFDEQTNSQGFIRGEIIFSDGSILHLREFVDIKKIQNRDMYSYQYMTSSKELIFRYDNTEHHKKLNLPNYPHHKHDGSQDNIISSNAPTLADVLEEIEGILE